MGKKLGPRKDLTGKVFGRLTVIEYDWEVGRRWKCKCECGKLTFVYTFDLNDGGVKSCSCLLFNGHPTHSQSRTSLYYLWNTMKQRCQNIKNINYKHYGGRGIKVCERWELYENFRDDMGHRPNSTSLDRIDNDGNYEPGNCRWASLSEQHNNCRSNVFITYKSIKKTAIQWATYFNINYHTFYSRLSRGWSMEEIVNTPVVKKKN